MEVIEVILLLIGILLFSNVINHYIPAIPASLIQVILGCGLALFTNFQIPLSTDWFLLLFIAPLLFNDGRRFPKKELWELKMPIFGNAIVLVFLTTIVGGFLIYKLIPSMPLSVSFALAAILSPTDPVAVQSIASKANLPSNILHLVNGESLINDASGLIAFKYAVAATVTGYFSIFKAAGDFVYTSIMGAIIGILTMLVITSVRKFLYRKGIKNVIFNVVLQIIAPFSIYMLSEEVFHASGVIAVVTAGIVLHMKNSTKQALSPELILINEKTWDIIIYILNGIVFLILGIELPFATEAVIKSLKFNTLQSIMYAVITWLVLLIIRIVWITGYQFFSNLFSGKSPLDIDLRVATIVGFSGVRGAITMAGVLSVPMLTSAGKAFPDRDLITFIASGVIVCSLIAAVIILPLISSNKDTVKYEKQDFWNVDKAKIHLLRAAINNIDKSKNQVNKNIIYSLIWQYQIAIRKLNLKLYNDEQTEKFLQEEVKIREKAIDLERKVAKNMLNNHHISKVVFDEIEQRINHRESEVLSEFDRFSYALEWKSAYQTLKVWIFKQNENDKTVKELNSALALVFNYTIKELRESSFSSNKDLVRQIILEYENLAYLVKNNNNKFNYDEQYRKLQIKAFGAQRKTIQSLFEDGKISWNTASDLRQEINYLENVELYSSEE
ncbi:Na+/H+ antiporter [Apilactobacillus xinyiensis]|uniref:Na+/H+ antiporter n=1 Tax=Apilactobacillus xinyiensis TaxID=2841032 RepID=UPI001C7D46D8|nr:Na+/H+ antiporter [Apilactobacillus xinyiensis]